MATVTVSLRYLYTALGSIFSHNAGTGAPYTYIQCSLYVIPLNVYNIRTTLYFVYGLSAVAMTYQFTHNFVNVLYLRRD